MEKGAKGGSPARHSASRRSVACAICTYHAETKDGTRYPRRHDETRQFRSRVSNGTWNIRKAWTRPHAWEILVNAPRSLRRDDFRASYEYPRKFVFYFQQRARYSFIRFANPLFRLHQSYRVRRIAVISVLPVRFREKERNNTPTFLIDN